MYRKIFSWAVTLALWCCGGMIQPISATHFMGVDMSYTCLPASTCQFRFTHKAYYDCTGAATPVPPNVPLYPFLNFKGVSTLPFCTQPDTIGGWVLVSYTEVTPVCPFFQTACTNPNSPINGVREAIFYRDYDFCNVNCTSYVANWISCCRNNTITSGAASNGIVNEVEINLAVSPCNNSPIFASDPIFYLCNGRKAVLSQHAFDPDGDSLVYSLTACQGSATQIVSYNTGFSASSPLGPTWNVTLDPATGDLTFDPASNSALMVGVVCIRVDEYRNGQKIGSVARDMQVTVLNCGGTNNAVPTIDSIISVTGGNRTGTRTFNICQGDTFSMFVAASDSNAFDSLTASTSLTNMFPSASISQTGTNPIVIQISMVATTSGTFNFNLKVEDVACPFKTQDNETYTLKVNSFCVSAQVTNSACGATVGAIDLTVKGGTPPYSFAWSNGATTEDLTGLAPGFYAVQITDSLGATLSDSFLVDANNISLNATVTPPSCNQPLGSISVAPSGGQGPYTYTWTTGDTTASVSGLGPGGYTVYVLDYNGCPRHQVFVLNPPDSCFNLIRGTVFHDANGNCVQDAGEAPVSFAVVDLTPGGAVMTDANGDYVIRADSGNSTLDMWPRPFATVNCPTSGNHVVSFSGVGNDTSGIDFALNVVQVQDLEVTLRSSIARPGRNLFYYLGYRNNGSNTMNGSVQLRHDTDAAFVNANPPQNSYATATRTLTWNFTNLRPAEFRQVIVTMSVDTTVQAGDTLIADASIFPITGDSTPGDNVFQLLNTARASYDPNDKQVFPQGIGMRGFIEPTENEMDYTVRFQNTGNDTAFYVVIRDTLDSDLDVTSLQIEGYSHDFSLNIENDEVLVFTFANINLPDSSTDLAGSQGFIAYSIKHDGTLAAGTEINNSAAIYFDFNAPIITNTVTNTVFTYPLVAVNQVNSLCAGDSISAEITQAGMPPYIFGWSDGTQDPNNQSGISYTTPTTSGTYSVQVTDAYGFTTSDQVQVTVNPSPDASFSVGGNGLTRAFTLSASTNTNWTWDLGDGTTFTNQQIITHRYPRSGTYTIKVVAENGCGIDSLSQTIQVIASSIDPGEFAGTVTLSPNPFSNTAILEFANPGAVLYELRILDLNGKEVQYYPAQAGNRFEILRNELTSGMYFYQLTGERQAVGKLWVE
ncbi:MAG: PKD domain-containing protein [Bacteroidota bacterium]